MENLSLQAIRNKIEQLRTERKYEEALKYAESLQRKYFSDLNFDDWFAKGICHFYLDQHKEATEAYGHALEHEPDNFPAMSNRGISFLRIGKIEEAFKLFLKAFDLNPNIGPAWWTIGQFFLYQTRITKDLYTLLQTPGVIQKVEGFNYGFLTKAVNAFRHAIKIMPTYEDDNVYLIDETEVPIKELLSFCKDVSDMSINEILQVEDFKREGIFNLPCYKCETLLELIRKEQSVRGPFYFNLPGVVCCNCTHDLLNEIPDPPGLLGAEELPLDMACNIVRDYDFILDINTSVNFFCVLFKGEPRIYDVGAIRLHSNGYVDQAFEILDRGLSECENIDQLLIEKAAMLGMEGKPEEGLPLLENVKDRSKNRYFTIKGKLLHNCGGDIDAAGKCWEQAMESDRDNGVLWINLGNYYLISKKDYKAAEKHYSEACKIFPECEAFYAFLGDSLFFQNRFKEAFEHYKKALSLPETYENHHQGVKKMLKECEKKLTSN